MLRIIRSGRLARAALLLAAALSISGSAGLHPEPAGAAPGRGGAVASASRVDGCGGAATHTCLVCLLHGTASAALAGDLAPTVLAALGAVALADPRPARSATSHLAQVRAPPSAF